jgi:hypothetical protein
VLSLEGERDARIRCRQHSPREWGFPGQLEVPGDRVGGDMAVIGGGSCRSFLEINAEVLQVRPVDELLIGQDTHITEG